MIGEILILLLLMMFNGIFAMAEISLVSSRRVRLEEQASRGRTGAKRAIELLNDPEAFLSTVQIGITCVGIVAGAYGGMTLSEDLAPFIASVAFLQDAANEIAIVMVVSGITYLSLVVGELLPKTIALNNPEAFAVVLAPPMKIMFLVARPLVRGLSGSTKFLIRLLRIRQPERAPITSEELRLLIQQGFQHGVLARGESEMMQRILSLERRTAHSIMTPRPEITWLDISDPWATIQQRIEEGRYTKFPVCDGTSDNVVGLLTLADYAKNRPANTASLRAIVQEALFIPEHLPVTKILERFREKKTYAGLVIDEFGDIEGLLTLHNIVESIMGYMPEEGESGESGIFVRADGSWLVDGSLPIEHLREHITGGLDLGSTAPFSTVSGLMMYHLDKVPAIGNRISLGSFIFEIVDMDGKRVDKVLIIRDRNVDV